MGTIAVTTLVAWYTLLLVHTHDPSPCLPRFPLSLSVFVSRPSSLDSFCTVRAFPPGANVRVHTRAHACTHTRAAARAFPLPAVVAVRALSPLASLFFYLLSRLAVT